MIEMKIMSLFVIEDNKKDAGELINSCKDLQWLKIKRFSDPENAIPIILHKKPDVISLDLLFGKAFMGYYTLEKAKRIDPTMGIIVVSEHPGQKNKAEEREIDSFITKDQIRETPDVFRSAIKRAVMRKIRSCLFRNFNNIDAIDNMLGNELKYFLATRGVLYIDEFVKTNCTRRMPKGISETFMEILDCCSKSMIVEYDITPLINKYIGQYSLRKQVQSSLPAECYVGQEIIFKLDIFDVEGDASNEMGTFFAIPKDTTIVDIIIHGNGFDISKPHIKVDNLHLTTPAEIEVPVIPKISGELKIIAEFYISGRQVCYVWSSTISKEA